jgi:hypothetical protein
MARGATDNRTNVERSPEDRARLEAIRERYRRERPTPEQLVASGEFEGPVLHGPYVELRAFCHLLKQARLTAGLTITEVAGRSGIDAGALSRLEGGRKPNPTVDTLGRWAAALGKSITLGLRDLPEATP